MHGYRIDGFFIHLIYWVISIPPCLFHCELAIGYIYVFLLLISNNYFLLQINCIYHLYFEFNMCFYRLSKFLRNLKIFYQSPWSHWVGDNKFWLYIVMIGNKGEKLLIRLGNQCIEIILSLTRKKCFVCKCMFCICKIISDFVFF